MLSSNMLICLSVFFPRAVMVLADPRYLTVMSSWHISMMTSKPYTKVSKGADTCQVSIVLNLCGWHLMVSIQEWYFFRKAHLLTTFASLVSFMSPRLVP